MSRFASRHLVTAASLGAVVLVIVLALATSTGRNIVDAILGGDSRELRRQLLDLGVGGVVVLLTVCLSHAIVPFPTELVSAAAGFVYGFWLALPLLLVCWLASALLAYWLAERFGRPLARRLVGTRRLARAEELMDRGGAATLLSLRLIPLIPYNAICYAAGITRVPLVRYSWTTVVGIVPLTVLVAYLGSRLKSPDFGDWRVWLLIAAFIAIVVAGQVVERRLRYRRAAGEENG
ncbi:MAG TPA: VTT domain-containing protein [Thermoleophilaceae bacterium]